MSNPTGKGGFQERKHQINRKGRPKNFDALRELAQQIAHEELQSGDMRMTTTEAILRKWATSKDPRLQMQFMDVAYGKVPSPVEVSGKDGGPVESKVSFYLPVNGRD